MSKIKKLIALTLALAMVLSVSAFAGSYKADTYADAASINSDCKSAIELLYVLDIMVGDGKNFNPESAVTRAEMAKMIYVILNYGDDDKAVSYTGGKFFSDVATGAWYEGYVNYAAATKLVQGRPDGTFGPNDAVTTAEAAKMLLTAIGYSAEARGYTGANWDKNVLSDASIIGLLNGYKANVNGMAPRQWVAVMFQNALLDALTFGTMTPGFSGLLTSGYDWDEDWTPETMGGKYYGLKEVNGVAIATYDAYIDGDKKADEYEVIIEDGNGKEWQIRGTGLGAADLGQKYRVIYKVSSSKYYDGTAYSVRSLSETAEARTLDMEVDVKYATSSNKAYNKYEFTIDEMVATFEDYEVNVLFSGVNESATGAYVEVSVDDLREMINEDVNNNIWKAIDTDVDGKIDYFYVTEYDYAVITDNDTHSKYGDYVYAEDVSSNDKLEFNDETRLYIEDCIISDDELVEDNFVKYTWSLDDGQYVMEVLEVSEEIEYAARDSKKGIHELDGTDYMIADAADEKADDVLVPGNLGDPMDYAYDGDLIVYIIPSDSNYTDIADINAQLVLVLDAWDDYSNSKIREQDAIEYMTIDGETHIAAYQDGESGSVEFDVLEAWLADVQQNAETGRDKYDNDQYDWENGGYSIESRLFILHEGTKGRVWLEELSNEGDDPNEQLDASTSVLDAYAVYGEAYSLDATLDATGSSVKLNGDKLAAEHSFFYGYFNGDGEAVYGVVTPEQLEKASDDSVYAQVLTLDNARGTRTTVVAGYIFAPDMTSDEAEGYLFVDEILKETSKNYYRANVTFDDGTQDEITIKKSELVGKYEEGYLYAYDYVVVDDYYKLTMVDVDDNNDELVDVEDEYVITENNEYEMDDEVIAIVRVQVDRDENRDEFDFERNPFEYDIVETKFVAVEDLTAEMIADGEDDDVDGYVQFTDYEYRKDDLMYIVIWDVMDRYLGQDLTDSPLVCLLAQEGAGKIDSARVYTDGTEYEVSVELTELSYVYSLDLVLYAEDEVLTYASLNMDKWPSETKLTGRIMIKGDSSSWEVADWTPDADVMPTEVALMIDGVEMGRTDVVKTYNGDTGAEVELTAEVWAEFIAAAFPAEAE